MGEPGGESWSAVCPSLTGRSCAPPPASLASSVRAAAPTLAHTFPNDPPIPTQAPVTPPTPGKILEKGRLT